MEIEPLDDILSEDFWIWPSEARRALDAVRQSVVAFDLDMQAAAAKSVLPASELPNWERWKREFNEYYNDVTKSFASWRLLASTSVLRESERMAADLSAWRARYLLFTGAQPTTPAPVRVFNGPIMGPMTASILTLSGVALIAYLIRK